MVWSQRDEEILRAARAQVRDLERQRRRSRPGWFSVLIFLFVMAIVITKCSSDLSEREASLTNKEVEKVTGTSLSTSSNDLVETAQSSEEKTAGAKERNEAKQTKEAENASTNSQIETKSSDKKTTSKPRRRSALAELLDIED